MSEQSDRWEALIAHLRARESASMSDLAEELGVTVRTVRRDIAALRMKGFDIEGERGRGGGIRFARYAPLPPLRLDEGEAIGLWLSVQMARRATGLPFSQGGSVGLDKVLAALPSPRRAQLRRLCARIVVGPPASATVRASAGEIKPKLLGIFERCFSETVCLSFQYCDRKGAMTQRRIEPHGLYVQSPVWYIVAIDIEKDATRMFRMDRITNPRPLSRSFAPSAAVLDEVRNPHQHG